MEGDDAPYKEDLHSNFVGDHENEEDLRCAPVFHMPPHNYCDHSRYGAAIEESTGALVDDIRHGKYVSN